MSHNESILLIIENKKMNIKEDDKDKEAEEEEEVEDKVDFIETTTTSE